MHNDIKIGKSNNSLKLVPLIYRILKHIPFFRKIAQTYITDIFNNQKVKMNASWENVKAIQNGHCMRQNLTKDRFFCLIIPFMLIYECIISWLVQKMS